jgi:hypothetical protein
MADETAQTPREPWTGYAELSPEERQRLLTMKFDEAKARGDQPYAVALAAAVANYELVLELKPDTTHAAALAASARDLHTDAGSWIPS